MTVRLTIIGLGKIGASVGLALAAHKEKLTRTGHDRSLEVARKAKDMDAIERVEYNLPASVEGADIILLALPADQIHDTLKFIAQDVREDAVILDTSPIKTAAATWVQELLPLRRHYVGLAPALGPDHLDQQSNGLANARADLFQHGVMAIAAPPGTPAEALQLAADLVTMLGAAPLFADLAELDGVMAAAHLLPQLTAAALVEATTSQPGWSDIRKLAGPPYARTTSALGADGTAALVQAVGHNRENVIRTLDNLIAALQTLRTEVAEESTQPLSARLEHLLTTWEAWQQERLSGDWKAIEIKGGKIPTVGQVWRREVGEYLSKLFRPFNPDAERKK
ncbi:MAG: prephenate dehydrogenase/arogenate dehydrogenase family protein [Anaerolineales bacterium]|nr:prephenate dehydrogenase/arogenate dehydrogenase family protein [Anaerolineales bacterium]